MAAEPDLTIAELQTRLAAEDIRVSPSAISRFLVACGLTRKKDPARRPDVAAARAAWRKRQPVLNPERLVFIDEPGPRLP